MFKFKDKITGKVLESKNIGNNTFEVNKYKSRYMHIGKPDSGKKFSKFKLFVAATTAAIVGVGVASGLISSLVFAGGVLGVGALSMAYNEDKFDNLRRKYPKFTSNVALLGIGATLTAITGSYVPVLGMSGALLYKKYKK